MIDQEEKMYDEDSIGNSDYEAAAESLDEYLEETAATEDTVDAVDGSRYMNLEAESEYENEIRSFAEEVVNISAEQPLEPSGQNPVQAD